MPISAPPVTTLTTPAGSTSFISETNLKVDKGVNGEGLTTTVQPTRSAGMMCHTAISSGQFQGVIEPTTPSGLRCTVILPAALSWIVSSGNASPAVTRDHATAPPSSKFAPGPLCVFPCSRVTNSESSWWCFSIKSAMAVIFATRSASARADHAGNALRAAATAASTSLRVASGQAATTVPSAGFNTSKVFAVDTERPPIVRV